MDTFDINPLQVLISRLEEFTKSFIAISPNIIAAVMFILLTWFVAWGVRKLLKNVLHRAKMRHALAEALIGLTGTAIWLSGILISAMIALPGLTPANALAGLGIGSIAIGLAFKDIFENYLAGLLILVREPMRINDYVECQDIEGQVKRIAIRDTYLRRTDGVLVMVPNAFLFKNPVRVLTDEDLRRQTLIVGVAYGESVSESRSVIEKAMENLETVNKSKPVQVFAQEFASSSINFEVAWWTRSRPLDIRKSRDEVVDTIKSALDKANIEIPFPYRTLTFKEPLNVNQSNDNQSSS